MKKPKIYYVDGGTKNNGLLGSQESFICITDEKGVPLVSEPVGDKTNNETELLAVLRCVRLSKKPKKIYSDSSLSVFLVRKAWHTKLERLQSIVNKIWLDPAYLDLEWIPREENKAGYIIEDSLGL